MGKGLEGSSEVQGSLRTRIWIQLVGAMFFIGITAGEATGLLRPSFGIQMGWIIYGLAAATMLFEAWRSWRKMKAETKTKEQVES